MERTIIERHLTEAVAHVALGEREIARQRRVVAKLESDGFDADAARDLLAKLEVVQAMHVADRDRLRKELLGVAR